MKKIKNFIILAIAAAVFVLLGGSVADAHAEMRDITYTFGMDITVTGTVGSAITEQNCTISFKGGTKLAYPLLSGTDISSWFMGSETPLPAGLKVTVTEDADVGATSLKIKFSGTVYGASQDNIKVVPQNIYFDKNESDWYAYASVVFHDTVPKYNITRNTSVPSGFSAAGAGLYIKDQKSGTSGWKLSGEKGKVITQNNEMQVFIDGNFITPISAGYNISNWFNGDLYCYESQFGSTRGSVFPEGVTARIKNAVNIGDNTFTIVFSGTPSKGSRDLIAFTIPAGVVSYNRRSITKGDYQSGCKVTVTNGHFCYDISTDDSSELYTEYIKITYPEAVLEAGKPVTEDDNLIVTLEIVGKVNDSQITFKGVTKNKSTIRGLCFQDPKTGRWNDHLYNATGLEATVIDISADGKTISARITGTPKKQSSYPYRLNGRGYILNASSNSANHLISGYTSGDTMLTIVEPTLGDVTISENISITKGVDDGAATASTMTFTINLGDDVLAKDLPQGQALEVFYKHTNSEPYDYEYNGITLYVNSAAKAGDNQIRVRLYTKGSNMSTFKGYLNLSLPKEYIKRTNEYGSSKYYDIPFSRIYVDVVKTEREWVKVSDFSISGIYNNEYISETRDHDWYDGDNVLHHDTETYVTGIKLNPIGKGKVQFTVTLDPVMRIAYDFEAGESVSSGSKKFISLSFGGKNEGPFYSKHDLDLVEAGYGKDFKFYDIKTTEAIPKLNPDKTKPRVLHLEIDLGEFYYVRTYVGFADVLVDAMRTDGDWDYEWYRTEGAARIDIHLPGASGGTDSGIIYNSKDIILYATDNDDQKIETSYINLSEEKLVTDFAYTYYSLDGGQKWKETKTAITDKQLAGFLNKGMTLMLTDSYDKKAKKLGDNAKVLSFPKINARPAAVKYKVDYVTYADTTGATAGQWMLADKNFNPVSAEDLSKLEIGVAGEDKKLSEDGYGSWPSSGGLNLAPLSGNKMVTIIYFVRTKATDDTPASKMVKVSVKGQQAAPKTKVDYKNEQIKLKKGEVLYFGENISGSVSELPENAATYDDYAGKMVVAGDSAKVVDISPYITDTRNTVMIWSTASSKKAASAIQTIKLAARAPITVETIACEKGKMNLDKKYEVYDPVKGKWGGAPKVTASGEYKIRLKMTAKAGKEDDTTYAAGLEGTLKITYGVYDTAKKKSGITAAYIVIGSGTDSESGENSGSGDQTSSGS